VTVLEVIQRSTDYLTRKGVESPRLQVELLLAHQLKVPRLSLYLNFDRPLTPPDLDALRALVTRRGEFVPLQHLVGSTSFCGLEIGVGPEVLIPRPETELLAQHALDWLHAGAGTLPEPVVLDYGTGSGCLAVRIASAHPGARVHALDVSPSALERARDNARRHQLDSRVSFHESDGLRALPGDLRFDAVVSNPPYIPSAEIAQLQPEVRDHDPRLALDGGADGLDHYRRLAAEVPPVLKPGGRLFLELGDGQAPAVRALLEAQMWVVGPIYPDYSAHDRVLVAGRG
jgi:release factor glutamine methyltransferase